MANSEFIHSKINFMLEDNSKAKAKALSVYKDSSFFFIYDVKTINSGNFPNSNVYDKNIFRPKTTVAIELQIYFCNFKIKKQERNLRYFFKLIELYKLQNVKILLLLTLKIRQKEANKFIITSFRTKNICSTLNSLK